MKEITKEMIDIWEMSNMDWMGYTLERKNISHMKKEFLYVLMKKESLF